MLLNESATFPTTDAQPLSNFDRSSACCTNASNVPILKAGIANGVVVPKSVVTVERSAVRASSLSLEDDIEVGNDTRKNF